MSSPFSVTSSVNNAPSSAHPSFQMPSNFSGGFSYNNYVPPLSGSGFPPQQQQPQYPLPPGKNDLEILERLKETIKSNQHELFRPVPQPVALASIYLGPRSASHAPPHPEQILSLQSQGSSGHNGRGEGYQSVPDSHTGRVDRDGKGSGVSFAESGTRRNTQGLAEPWEDTGKSGAPPTVPLDSSGVADSSQAPNVGGSLSLTSQSMLDSSDKSLDMDPPGLGNAGLHAPLIPRTPQREPGPPSSSTTPGNGASRDYQSQSLTRSATEKVSGEPPYGLRSLGQQSPSKGSLDRKQDSLGSRDPNWVNRNASASQEDIKSSRQDIDRSTARPNDPPRMNTGDSYRPGQRYTRDFDRERDRDRDRERSRERDPHWDRDHDRDRRPDYSRFRDDRGRNDDRFRYTDNRRPPPEERHYEPRYDNRNADPPRRWDSKSSVDSNLNPRHPPPDEDRDTRGPRPLGAERSLESRGARPLGEERSLGSRLPPTDDRRPPSSIADDISTKPGPPPDDRRPLGGPPDRLVRPVDDRRPPPPSSSALSDRPVKAPLPPVDERRSTGPAPLSVTSSSASLSDRIGRPVGPDDRHVRPPSPSPRLSGPAPASGSVSGDRPARLPGDDTRRPGDGYSARTDAAPLSSSTTTAGRPPASDRQDPPRQVPLEERISRQPSLQERLSSRPGDPPRSNVRPADDRPTGNVVSSKPPVKLEERVSALPPAPDTRAPLVDSRAPPPETRGRPPVSDRFPPAPSDKGPPPPSSTGVPSQRPQSYADPRPPPPREDTSRSFKPRTDVSPRRNEYRPPDRLSHPDRFERDRSRDKRPDNMNLDPPRFGDRPPPPATYRRPSPAPYNRQDRSWAPTDEPYGGNVTRRPPPGTAPSYGHDWQGDNRPPYDDWERRDWGRDRALDRDREYERDRDGRFIERDAPVPSWETREERDRRISGGFPASDAPPPPSSRTYDARPLSARLSDGYPPVDDRDRAFDRSRYAPPPIDSQSLSYSRVRPRSPSPPRRGMDDLRPPIKRPRDDGYGPGYYPPSGLDSSRDYPPPRMRSPPPAGGSAGYYDEPPRGEFGLSSAGPPRDRDRDYGGRDGYGGYDRRDGPIGRSPSRPPPPSFARGGYDRRYSVPPRG